MTAKRRGRQGAKPVKVVVDEWPANNALVNLVTEMQEAYDHVRAELLKTISLTYQQEGVVPEDILDANGRSVLLDAMLKLLDARMMLARHEMEIYRNSPGLKAKVPHDPR